MVPVALPACGLPATSKPPVFTCAVKLAGPSVPPSLLTTFVITWSLGAMSSAVIVQVRAWPSWSVIEPLAAQSPDTESA